MKLQNETKNLSDVWGVSGVCNIKLGKNSLVDLARDVPFQTSNIVLAYKNSCRLLAINFFCKNHQIFGRILNWPK